jgi:hypothetical protein
MMKLASITNTNIACRGKHLIEPSESKGGGAAQPYVHTAPAAMAGPPAASKYRSVIAHERAGRGEVFSKTAELDRVDDPGSCAPRNATRIRGKPDPSRYLTHCAAPWATAASAFSCSSSMPNLVPVNIRCCRRCSAFRSCCSQRSSLRHYSHGFPIGSNSGLYAARFGCGRRQGAAARAVERQSSG